VIKYSKTIFLVVFLPLLTSVVLASDIQEFKKECAELGFKYNSTENAKCALKLLKHAQKNGETFSSASSAPAQRQTGDGSRDDSTCQSYGFSPGSAPYSECRMKLDMFNRQAAAQQQEYAARQQQYQQELAAYQEQQKQARGMAMMRCGLNMMAGGTCTGAPVGPAPLAPQPMTPYFQTYTINGRIINCTTTGQYTNCN
jgi:hypothetical protein